MKAIATDKVVTGQFVTLRRRSWRERLLSWPWRPCIAIAAIPLNDQSSER